MKSKVIELIDDSKSNEKSDKDKNGDRNKFKKVEMPIFNGEDPIPSYFGPIDTSRFKEDDRCGKGRSSRIGVI